MKQEKKKNEVKCETHYNIEFFSGNSFDRFLRSIFWFLVGITVLSCLIHVVTFWSTYTVRYEFDAQCSGINYGGESNISDYYAMPRLSLNDTTCNIHVTGNFPVITMLGFMQR